METKQIGKKLYAYQQEDLEQIFERFKNCPSDYNLVYQLPTGGGKTVVFSEIARKYIEQTGKKVVILTHRIELCNQTSSVLQTFGVTNKIINSKVKDLPDQDDYMCFVAMVETLNNRLQDSIFNVENVGLVIIDEAHYNSFRKLFKYFEKCFLLGVTATPLSSNIKLPMKDSYDELIVGCPIPELIQNGFLAKVNTFCYDIVGLGALEVGINGDYTVKSSEELYSSGNMQNKLLYSYKQRAMNKKTLIFNAGIKSSRQVYETFKGAGLPVRHLDSLCSRAEREETLIWFKVTPNAILSSVSILTTGFDEPTIQAIILNRATRSLSLYFQMIGRGSRVLPTKDKFDVIDLGNNVARFGHWAADIDWQKIFRSPDHFLTNIISDDEIERNFRYVMPEEMRDRFSKSEHVNFDITKEYKKIEAQGMRTRVVVDQSIDQHARIVMENCADFGDALSLIRLLDADIADRIRRYSYCIAKNTRNYRDWLIDDYKRKLRAKVTAHF